MKTLYVVCLVLALASCSGDDVMNPQRAREIAWNSLSTQTKATVITQWQQARVSSETYQNARVYAVIFNTTEDPLLGPLIVYVDKLSARVVGYAPRF